MSYTVWGFQIKKKKKKKQHVGLSDYRYTAMLYTCMLSHNLFYVVLQASLYIPVLILKARKFAMLYTLGSLFVISRYEKL